MDSDSRSNGRNVSSDAGSGSQALGNVNDRGVREPVQLHLEQEVHAADLDKARREGKLDAELAKLGLEPTKEAYQQKMAPLRSADRQNAEKRQSRLSRFLFGKRANGPGEQASLPKPCQGEDCKPAPKPCKGKNCKPTPPPCQGPSCAPGLQPPGQAYACLSEVPQPLNNATCIPWGYLERCDRQGNCFAHLARMNVSDCDAILTRLKEEQERAALLDTAQQNACSGPQNAQCASAMKDYQTSEARIEQLIRLYKMCLMAARP